MMNRARRFNLYFLVAFCAALLITGCNSMQKKGKAEEASLRLHLEINSAGGAQGTNVIIGRTATFAVNVDREPFLSEFNMEWAKVEETLGGFSIVIQFNATGTIL